MALRRYLYTKQLSLPLFGTKVVSVTGEGKVLDAPPNLRSRLYEHWQWSWAPIHAIVLGLLALLMRLIAQDTRSPAK